MKHGDHNTYSHRGCRCERCKDAYYGYHRAWRERLGRLKGTRPHLGRPCHNVTVDTDALRRILAADERPVSRIEADAGLSQSAIYRVLERGRCSAATFDALCSALELHGYEIESTTAMSPATGG